MSTVSQLVRFDGAHGHSLAGRIERPDQGRGIGAALFAHCFTCGKDLAGARRIARGLAAQGFVVLSFDFAGLGESEGDFADTNFSSNVEDLIAAARWLEREHRGPELLVGHSLGGPAVLSAAGEIPSCRAVATIGAPCEPTHVRRLLHKSSGEIEAQGEAMVSVGGRPFRVRRQFLEDLEAHQLGDVLKRFEGALLVMHSPADEIVSIENASCLFQAARHPKSFVSLNEADHLLRRPSDARFVADVLGAWARHQFAEASTN